MYKSFTDIDELKRYVELDKQADGIGSATLDRYPIRFVLFDNFKDCYAFVEYLQSEVGAHVESVDKWIDADYPDLMITYVELSDKISAHIRKKSPYDCVIAPFSELARFYENEENKTFDALLKTIKAIEATPEAVGSHQRVYIPIVGLEGKMETFRNDSQINIWRLAAKDKDLTYKLILTPEKDFGVKGLEKNFTVVGDIREWLNVWKDDKRQVRPSIICQSRSIYANARHARPDNAFEYVVCDSAYEFLTNGLGLSFGNMERRLSDGDNWDLLAADIDVGDGFSFANYIKCHFAIDDITGYKDFIRLWFSHPGQFDRWLLARYYIATNGDDAYICKALGETGNYATNEFLEYLALSLSEVSGEIEKRRYCLGYAARMNAHLSVATEAALSNSLTNLPQKMGYASALKYFTGISQKEREIAISWLGKGAISVGDVAEFYPDLSSYASEGVGANTEAPAWLDPYIAEYKRAKLGNKYTLELGGRIAELNASESAFNAWYESFSTTYTLLQDRKDIEVFYWIDGLGVDWIPFVRKVVEEWKDKSIYLNEVKIARAKLPTRTDINKSDLQRLMAEGETLEKTGDLDALAHRKDNRFPELIDKEIALVRKTIEGILEKFSGKKIAIVSDHGLTYMSQLRLGQNLAGVESDHNGRIATVSGKMPITADTAYYRLEDGKTICALTHESLCAKVPAGQGAHGGCSPEEALVPIFIVSNAPVAASWSVELQNAEVSGSDPKIRMAIKNAPAKTPVSVRYNNATYAVHHTSGNLYETDALILDSNVREFTLIIGLVEKTMKINVSMGLQEEDLFGF